jgi:hypothetical protein
VGLKKLEGLANYLQKYRETAKITEIETAYTTDNGGGGSGRYSLNKK